MTTISLSGYDVHVGAGMRRVLPQLLTAVAPGAAIWAVIADQHVAELHGTALMDSLRAAGVPARLFTFPAGEWNKTREEWASLTDAMIAAGLGRDCAVLTFGGGVAGDLGGFVAATFQRGVPVVHLPTTLLAMIDAAVGGKTAVDVPAGKNLVGAFHPPAAVMADVELLATLPRTQLASGLAEAVKHGVIADAAYFDLVAAPEAVFEKDSAALEALVTRSVQIKAAIVRRDERETGERAVLNFGHTIGHAVEAAAGYGLLHGEAIAIGMMAEAWIAEHLGLAAGVRNPLGSALERCGLPTLMAEDYGTERLFEFMARDKKVRGGVVRLALPAAIGAMARGPEGEWTIAVQEEVLRQALDTARG